MITLKQQIERIETLISIYNGRDEIRVADLEAQLHVLEMQLLEYMTIENEKFLRRAGGLV